MAVERWTDDRLDQLANDVEGNKQSISELRLSTADLRTSAELLLQTAQIHQANFERVIVRIDRMQAEIRGLQLENRRMLEMRGLPPEEQDEPTP